MALSISFTLTKDSDCLGASFVDTSGSYSSSNTTGWKVSHSITGVSTGNDTFTISGNQLDDFLPGVEFEVTGSTGNDGTWTVESISYDGTDTTITAEEDISNSTADGNIELGDTELVGDVDTAVLTIENTTNGVTYDDIAVTPNDTTTIDSEDLEVAGTSIGAVVFPDGYYKFTYTVTMDDEAEYTYCINKVFLCESACELTDLATQIINDECGCNNNSLRDYFRRGFNWYKIIQWGASTARQDKTNETITNLQSFLDSIDCDCI